MSLTLSILVVAASLATEPSTLEPIPATKKCVDGRQTEDPSSPPCQAFYEGDNGGATWQGVTADEITVLIYQSTQTTHTGTRTEKSPPGGTYCDVVLLDCDGDGIEDSDPHVLLRVANAFARYFNDRYQTYDRFVHTYMYWSSSETPSGRRADAADNWERLKSFAVIDQAPFGGYHDVFATATAARDSMVFGDFGGLPRDLFTSSAPYIWSYWPDIESSVDQYAGYVCSKVAPTKVASGEFKGQARRYALYHSTDPGYSGQLFSQGVRDRVAECDVTIGDEDVFTFPYSGWAVDLDSERTYALRNAARMKLGGYNTILWAGGSENDTSKAADALAYHPEWIVAGDGIMDGRSYAATQGQASWANAWTISHRPRVGALDEDPGYQAYKEAEPSGEDGIWASLYYRDWFMLFLAIQLSGSTLNPTNAEAGLRALPPTSSTSPYVAGGWFPEGEFTYVRDANEGWWDPTGIDPRGNRGCYRLVDGGRRYSSTQWSEAINAGLGKRTVDGSPDGNERNPADPCTAYSGSLSIRPPGFPL